MIRREFIGYSATGIAGSFLIPNGLEGILDKDEKNGIKTLPKSAKFIWYDTEGMGRNLYANFRKAVFLDAKPGQALFNVFADSSYQLFVNGNFVQQGPVRFDPRFPVYDTHDLAPFLKQGENVIAVQANYFGCKTYKSISNRAGFLCWGNINTGQKTINLDSSPSNWKVMKANEHDKYVNKLSFALNPAVLYDQQKEAIGWKNPGYNDTKWKNATAIAMQNSWGNPAPRAIPYMSGERVEIVKVNRVNPLIKQEQVYSFSMPFPDAFEDGSTQNRQFYVAFHTWIYSEKDQKVKVGAFWGENWINGVEVGGGVISPNQSLRLIQTWNLKKGWNHLFGKVGPYFDNLTHFFGLPLDAHLVVSADKDLYNSHGVIFRRTPHMTSDQFEKTLAVKTLPYAEDEKLAEIGGWVDVTIADKAQSPCFESNWDFYGEQFEKLKPADIDGHIFRLADYPNGFSMLIDTAFMHLSYPILNMEGVKGATVDVVCAELLATDNAHLLTMFNYQPGDRIICSEPTLEWLPTHPRGIRYLNITVRNPTSDIKINSLTIRSANYPVKHIGNFTTSDTMMNEIWKLCERTQKANMEDAYVDCSGRERGMYIRDTIIQYYNNLVTFGDKALMRRCLELYSQSTEPKSGKLRAVYPNSGEYTISDFSLNIVEGFKIYYENTGDKQLITSSWAALMKNLKWFDDLSDEREDKLLDAEWHLKRKENAHYGGFHGDLGIIEGHMDNTGIHCVFSLTYLIALQNAFYLAEQIGQRQDANNIQNRIVLLTKNVQKFWNPDKQCFSDNLDRRSHSVHASLFAIRAGIASVEQKIAIKKYVGYQLRYLFADGFNPENGVYMSPSFSFYILDGLYKAGMEDIAENIIRQGWGWILYHDMKTTPEYFSVDPFQSMCHAWSACPVYYLSRYTLGVTFPNAPDLSKVEIKVQTSDKIQNAEGVYPHPAGGLIEIKWHMENGKRVFDHIKVPTGITVKVINS